MKSLGDSTQGRQGYDRGAGAREEGSARTPNAQSTVAAMASMAVTDSAVRVADAVAKRSNDFGEQRGRRASQRPRLRIAVNTRLADRVTDQSARPRGNNRRRRLAHRVTDDLAPWPALV